MFSRTRSIWQRLRGSEPATTAILEDDRRAHVRYPSDRSMLVRADGAETEPMTARVHNVSRGGIRFVVNRCLDRGCTVRVDMPPVSGQPVATVLACVVHVQMLRDDEWSVGCSFATELNDADLSCFGVKSPAPSERRTTERIPARGTVVYSFVDDDGPGKSAPIHNVSLNGVALILNEKLETGRLLNLDMHNEAGEAVFTIVACIVYLGDAGNGTWTAGCNFIRELDESELVRLLQ